MTEGRKRKRIIAVDKDKKGNYLRTWTNTNTHLYVHMYAYLKMLDGWIYRSIR